MQIRKMTAEDIPFAAEIEKLCFVHPWSEQSITQELCRDGSVFLMAFEENRAVGYVGLSTVLDEGYMGNLAVIADFRRKGVGRALMTELIKACEESQLSFVTLEVRSSNIPAISLYNSLGFNQVGLRKNYYKEPVEDALLLTKFLKETNI